MRLNKFLVLTIVAILLSAPVYAATCGDNNAQGNEECDGTDLRGYDCATSTKTIQMIMIHKTHQHTVVLYAVAAVL